MNESYLFRGKRSDNLRKNWVTGHYVSVPRHMIVLEELQQNGSWYCFDADPSTIGRCTGLTAAKSYRGDCEDARRVFEHDIFWDGDYEAYFTVRWDNLLAAWIADYGNDHAEWLGDTLNANTEIVSTIHDNPDLLEAQ